MFRQFSNAQTGIHYIFTAICPILLIIFVLFCSKSYKHIYFGGFCVVIIVIFVALAKKTICDKRRQEKGKFSNLYQFIVDY